MEDALLWKLCLFFLCFCSWSGFVPLHAILCESRRRDINLDYEKEWKSQNKIRGESANGKEQNTTGKER